MLCCAASPDVTRQVFASVDRSSASLTKHTMDLQYKIACDSSAQLCDIQPTGCICVQGLEYLKDNGDVCELKVRHRSLQCKGTFPHQAHHSQDFSVQF
jgi:hypothetical protein